VVAVGSGTGGRAVVVTAVTETAPAAGLAADALVKRLLGGRGGGSARTAQGGGLAADHLAGVLEGLPGLVVETAERGT
ncbi:hypothetical protein, partial [Streptomyces albidoflavus]